MRPASAGHSPIETFEYKAICRWGGVNERRTWNNPTREPWNPVIHQCLRAIDHHNTLYFQTGDEWHLLQCTVLRQYVTDLKNWIHLTENEQKHSRLESFQN